MWICKYFVYFVIFSFFGWVYESTFCTIKRGKWENRGFLYGPICPIYGVGAASITWISEELANRNIEFVWWQVFVVGFFGSIVLEYVTAWALETMFHAIWWDYSKMPLNIKGRVCFPCSCGFGVAGLIVIYWVAPFTRHITDWASPAEYELWGLILMAVVSIDTTLTVSALSNFERYVIAAEDVVNRHMDSFVNNLQEKTVQAGVTIKEGTQNAGTKLLEGTQSAGSKLLEGTQNAGSKLLEGKQALAGKISEERSRFTRENTEHMLSTMSGLSRSAVSRIKGIRRPEKERKQFEFTLEVLKKYTPKVRNKNSQESDVDK